MKRITKNNESRTCNEKRGSQMGIRELTIVILILLYLASRKWKLELIGREL
jgi:hypothetical protein